MSEQKYTSEVMRVINKQTGNKTYYIKDCCSNQFRRISFKEYDQRYDQAFGVANLFTEQSKNFTRYYTTLVYYI